ncbi:MAG: hypothetical protein CMJ13_07105 [Pelagibacterales bacterium]|nr:hypothetical protein [Pelagibacterales bacterium]
MQKDYDKICNSFFREAELGNWQKLNVKSISKKLKLKEQELKEIIPSKNHFLNFYNTIIDKEVINSISKEELKISSNDEIIQEYFMYKLDLMKKYKFGFINILNTSLKDPGFLLINLKSNKESIKKYVKRVSKTNNNFSRVLLIKLLLGVWLVAFNKWLYEDDDSETGLAVINKGISKIKKSTNLFNKI